MSSNEGPGYVSQAGLYIYSR